MNREYFTVTKDHLKLLRKAYVSWDSCEFGAPAIDCKRPYGNSDVFQDIAKILGINPIEDIDEELYTNTQEDYMRRIHKETETVLQIILRTGLFEAGVYSAESPYHSDWEKEKPHQDDLDGA